MINFRFFLHNPFYVKSVLVKLTKLDNIFKFNYIIKLSVSLAVKIGTIIQEKNSIQEKWYRAHQICVFR